MTATHHSDGMSTSGPANPWLRLLGAGGWLFSISIGLSACLLFTLELMVGQMLLPLLGGAPSVWATTLGFFQLVLLLGYLYAHVSVTRLGRLGPLLHLVLAIASLAAIGFGPNVSDLHYDTLNPVLQVLVTLTVAVGLPAFVLCATTPLLSAWLTSVRAKASAASGGAGADPARDPYRLYVVSNAGSLLALLAYPLVVEPTLGLGAQRGMWNAAFVALFGLLLAVGGLRVAASGRSADGGAADTSSTGHGGTVASDNRATGAAAPGEHLAFGRVARWLFLAAVPCGLLSAVTNFITTDLISTPLLWVGPLAVYLGTFIVAFSAKGLRPVAFATRLAPATATMLWIPFGYSALWPTLPLLMLELGGFAVIALALHGSLAADRPGPARLTFFYLVVSAGGVLGGAFVGFVAPVVFPGIWEYPILLVAALAGAPAVGVAARRKGSVLSAVAAAHSPNDSTGPGPDGLSDDSTRAAETGRRGLDLSPFVEGARVRVVPFVVIAVAAVIPVGLVQPLVLLVLAPFLILGGLILTLGAKPQLLATATAVVLIATVVAQPVTTRFTERSFFGVVTVKESDTSISMWHGTTNHGSQWLDPARSREPRAYYYRLGPLGDAMALAQARGAQNVGIVGLGAGSIAAYERPSDRITFFEIDPAVVRAAEDPKLFTFLSEAPTRPAIIVGDGRLELRKIPDATYDLLILDAFSGDSIPTHLLTVEALRDDVRVLKPGGILIVHVSNRYYNLAPAVAAGARDLGLSTMDRPWQPSQAEKDDGALACEWAVMSADAAALNPLLAQGWTSESPAAQAITDDYPDVMRFANFASWLTGR